MANSMAIKSKKEMNDLKASVKNSLNGMSNSEQNIRKMIKKSLKELELDPEKHQLTRNDIVNLGKTMGLVISYFQATEIMIKARGEKLEKSVKCDVDKIVEWLVMNIKIL
jgi:hypothetical protein